MSNNNISKYIGLPDDILAEAYIALFSGFLTEDEIKLRPVKTRAARVRDILEGKVTPGCQAGNWFRFFEFLQTQESAPALAGTLSPAEWLEEYDPDLKKWVKDGGVTTLYDIKNMLETYARHVAGVVARNVRHRAADYDSIHNVRDRFYEFINQTDLDPEIAEIVNENFWDLL